MVRKVIWDKQAIFQLNEIYNYIKERSPQSATKVRKSIKDAIRGLAKHPEVHNLDKFKTNNDGSFRAFEVYRNRVTYKVKETEVIIVRIRHTSRETLKH